MNALRRRFGRAGARDPMAAFRAAARKVDRQIARYAAGEIPEEEARGIDKLYDRANKPEIRGDDASREEAHRIIDELLAKRRAAHEPHRVAKDAARSAEMRASKEAERDRLASMDPARRAYEKELTLLRGGR